MGFAVPPKTIFFPDWGYMFFPALPSSKVPQPFYGKGIYKENLFFSISEEIGLEIENNKDDVLIYFFFYINGREKITYKYYNQNPYNSSILSNTEDNLKADNVKIIIANKSSGRIYYEKDCSIPNTPPKKN
jgi:hypothetical protein